MKATRIPQLVLVCVISLAVASTVGLTVLSSIALSMDATTLKDFLDAPKRALSMTQRILPMGDPIDDPKPNKH